MSHRFPERVLALAGALLAFGPGQAAAGPAFDPVLVEIGAEAYPRYCGSCHGVRGEGDGPTASALRTRPADLTRIAARRGGVFPAGEIARFIDGRFTLPAHGSREMPVWGERFGEAIPEASVAEEITRGKIATLVEYLKSIQRKD
jgi:mono/diheme cytochrome c family protein